MDYDEYVVRFLTGLYVETELSGSEYHSAGKLHEKYGLKPKSTWVSRMSEEFEYRYFREISKVLESYDGWNFRLAPDGYRRVEQGFDGLGEMQAFLGGLETETERVSKSKPLSTENFKIPASDRLVKLNHNQPDFSQATTKADELLKGLTLGNDIGDLSADEVAAAAAEVNQLKLALEADTVRQNTILLMAKRSLLWVAEKAGEAVIGQTALALIVAIFALFGIGVVI